jgi:hypothetical protein
VIVKLPEAVFPAASVAVQVTVVVPIGKVDPEAGVQTTGTGPSITSRAEAPKVAIAPAGLVAARVSLAGRVRTGAVLSPTVTVKVPEAVFPAASVAVHVIVVVPIGNVDPEAGVQTTGIGPSIASRAEALKVAIAPAGLVAASVSLAGRVRTGAVLSPTVTVKVPEAAFPAASVAVQVTVVVPIGNVDPEAGVQTTATGPSIASTAEAVNVAIAPAALVAPRVSFAGRVRTGAVLSPTVIVKLPEAVFPAASVAVQLTVVVPIGNVDPEAGVQITATGPSIASRADALKVAIAPAGLVAARVSFAGSVRTGAVLSPTATVKVPEAVFPAASVAVHVTVVVPIGKVDPEAGVQTTGTGPSIASRADALKVAIAPAVLVAARV